MGARRTGGRGVDLFGGSQNFDKDSRVGWGCHGSSVQPQPIEKTSTEAVIGVPHACSATLVSGSCVGLGRNNGDRDMYIRASQPGLS